VSINEVGSVLSAELSGLQSPGDFVGIEDDAGWKCLRAYKLK